MQDVKRMLFDCWKYRTNLKDLWRCVKKENGRQCVIKDGVAEKQEWYAGNWGLLKIQEVIIS